MVKLIETSKTEPLLKYRYTLVTLLAIVISLIVVGKTHAGDRPDPEYAKKIQSLSYRQVISEIETPEQAQQYLLNYLTFAHDQKIFGEKDYIASFERIHTQGSDDCDGGVIAAAALLSDNGYPPLSLCMYKKEHTLTNVGGHAIFIYKQDGKWGTLGILKYDCQSPRYKSVEEIVRKYGFDKFNIINIGKEYPDWLTNTINMNTKIYRPDSGNYLPNLIE